MRLKIMVSFAVAALAVLVIQAVPASRASAQTYYGSGASSAPGGSVVLSLDFEPNAAPAPIAAVGVNAPPVSALMPSGCSVDDPLCAYCSAQSGTGDCAQMLAASSSTVAGQPIDVNPDDGAALWAPSGGAVAR